MNTDLHRQETGSLRFLIRANPCSSVAISFGKLPSLTVGLPTHIRKFRQNPSSTLVVSVACLFALKRWHPVGTRSCRECAPPTPPDSPAPSRCVSRRDAVRSSDSNQCC